MRRDSRRYPAGLSSACPVGLHRWWKIEACYSCNMDRHREDDWSHQHQRRSVLERVLYERLPKPDCLLRQAVFPGIQERQILFQEERGSYVKSDPASSDVTLFYSGGYYQNPFIRRVSERHSSYEPSKHGEEERCVPVRWMESS